MVNWRNVEAGERYSRYDVMIERFRRALADVSAFVKDEQLAQIGITQAELSYINHVAAPATENGVGLEELLRGWPGTPPKSPRAARAGAAPAELRRAGRRASTRSYVRLGRANDARQWRAASADDVERTRCTS